MLSVILLVVMSATALLVFAVVHDVRNRPDLGLEFSCGEDDAECLVCLCPEKYKWLREKERCAPPLDLGEMGVAPNTYKPACRPGFIWVPWRERCHRRRRS